ncbi:helix-turn-helix transcriptional regulator [Szabonella alba]|uniref:AlpA family phage regulatory protein n=1 Tax=Szabonella alba TaxID=2804194 RepID=A0A8K0VGE0_9RHOB|nr:AlpA family phage regulatory protein [Szabonella alba]MBL4919310.1 AlpA family phage regulatory protein [Szabonella alba]
MQPSETQEQATPATAARLLTSGAVRKLCGGISKPTLHRWMNRPELGFPKPITIGQRNYWRESGILAWLDAREVAA